MQSATNAVQNNNNTNLEYLQVLPPQKTI